MAQDNLGGHWITLKNGRHVFIKDGQSPSEAIEDSKKLERAKEANRKRKDNKEYDSSVFRKVSLEEFQAAVVEARNSLEKAQQDEPDKKKTFWRVTAHSVEELKKWYSDADFYVTKGRKYGRSCLKWRYYKCLQI